MVLCTKVRIFWRIFVDDVFQMEIIMIRQATLEDIPAIREMASVVFPATYGEILSAEQLPYVMINMCTILIHILKNNIYLCKKRRWL